MALIHLYCKPATFSTIWVRGINLRQNRVDVYSCDIFLDVIVYCSSSGHVFSTTCCRFQYISSCYTLRSIIPHYTDHIYQHSLSDMSQHFVFNLTPCSNCVFDKSYRKYIKELFFGIWVVWAVQLWATDYVRKITTKVTIFLSCRLIGPSLPSSWLLCKIQQEINPNPIPNVRSKNVSLVSNTLFL